MDVGIAGLDGADNGCHGFLDVFPAWGLYQRLFLLVTIQQAAASRRFALFPSHHGSNGHRIVSQPRSSLSNNSSSLWLEVAQGGF